MDKQNIRIKLRAYDNKVLDKSTEELFRSINLEESESDDNSTSDNNSVTSDNVTNEISEFNLDD